MLLLPAFASESWLLLGGTGGDRKEMDDVFHSLCLLASALLTLQEDGAGSTSSAECANAGQVRPYMSGEPWALPGYMEAEYYDYGGQGVSMVN